MNIRIDISAGEFFELIRPAVLFASAILSTFVFAGVRKRGSDVSRSILWALATFALPLAVFPIYLVHNLIRRDDRLQREPIPRRFSFPALYLLSVLSFTCLYLINDGRGVDAHLARAKQAKLVGETRAVISEYEQALRLENNAHIRKLLGSELIEAGDWTRGLNELRLAERGGERDPLIAFRLATVYEGLGLYAQAWMEYERYVQSEACLQSIPEHPCPTAQHKIQVLKAEITQQ